MNKRIEKVRKKYFWITCKAYLKGNDSITEQLKKHYEIIFKK